MKREQKTTKLRKQINCHLEELAKLQEEILQPRKMIAASLIKRYLGTKKQKRVSYAFYLSVFKNGRTELRYISKNNVEEIRTQVIAWKRHQEALRGWRKLTEVIGQNLKQLGKMQDQLEQRQDG